MPVKIFSYLLKKKNEKLKITKSFFAVYVQQICAQSFSSKTKNTDDSSCTCGCVHIFVQSNDL